MRKITSPNLLVSFILGSEQQLIDQLEIRRWLLICCVAASRRQTPIGQYEFHDKIAMAELLDVIENSLEELEQRLLGEFSRQAAAAAHSVQIDPVTRQVIAKIENELRHELEHSGDNSNLRLQTGQHEDLRRRLSVVRRLLKANIPIAFIRSVHTGVEIESPSTELGILVKRIGKAAEREEYTVGKATFGSRELSQTGSHGSQRANTPDELRRKLKGKNVKSTDAVVFGSRDSASSGNQGEQRSRATFGSRELRQAASHQKNTQRATTPDKLRRKLTVNSGNSTDKAAFGSRDLMASDQGKIVPAKPGRQKNTDRDIATSPEEIRQKLARRQSSAPDDPDRAEFNSRDQDSGPPRR